jgi:hypothetical protein
MMTAAHGSGKFPTETFIGGIGRSRSFCRGHSRGTAECFHHPSLKDVRNLQILYKRHLGKRAIAFFIARGWVRTRRESFNQTPAYKPYPYTNTSVVSVYTTDFPV